MCQKAGVVFGIESWVIDLRHPGCGTWEQPAWTESEWMVGNNNNRQNSHISPLTIDLVPDWFLNYYFGPKFTLPPLDYS